MAEIDSIYKLVSLILDAKSAVIFLGPGASMEGTQGKKPYPSFENIIDTILQDWGFKPDEKKERLSNFLTILKKWEYEKMLSARLSRYLDGEPGLSHYYLAALSIALFNECNLLLYLTTNFDDLMRKAFTTLEGNPERKFTTRLISISEEMTSSKVKEIAKYIDSNIMDGTPVIVKLFGELYSQTQILRQADMRFHIEVEYKLMEWMKKPMIVIGYDFSDKIIRELFIAARSSAPVFLVNSSPKIPSFIKQMVRVHHIKSNFSDFISNLLKILRERNSEFGKTVEKILSPPAIFSPGFRSMDINGFKRILFLAGNPMKGRLRLDEKVRNIEESLRRSKLRERFVIYSEWTGHFHDLRRALLDHEPQIVHFVGHGKNDALMLEDDLGIQVLISYEVLSELFKLVSTHIKCVILNNFNVNDSQVKAIAKYIDYVIVMQSNFNDKVEIEFSVGFYDALGAGRSIEEAFEFGRMAVLQLYPNQSEHLVPLLIKKKKVSNKIILDANKIEEEIRTLIDTKSNMNYLEARVKMLELKKIYSDSFEILKSKFGFRFNFDNALDDDIYIQYRKKVVEKPFIYAVEFTNEAKNGCVNLALPNQQFMAIPETVFSIISKKDVAQLELLEIRERLEKRTQTLEQLFQLNLYQFAKEELRDILDLIEKNAGDVLTPLKEKIIDLLKEHYTRSSTNISEAGINETEKTNGEFRNKIRFIFEWGEFFSTQPIESTQTVIIDTLPNELEEKKVPATTIQVTEAIDSQKKGFKLEKALFELFQNLFMLNDSHEIKVSEKEIGENALESRETMLKQKRWQQSGTQYGYDLEFTWDEILISHAENSRRKSEVKCCVECKHYSNNINHYELMGKLAQVKADERNIDHWIMISPYADLTPTALTVLEKNRKDFPFDIHIWTREFRVEELFGINPEVFEELYELLPQYREDKIQNPRLWSDEYRLEIKKKWLEKLPPKYRLPSGKVLPESWVENLKKPEISLISYEGEDDQDMLTELNHAIKDDVRLCMNENGSIGTLLQEYLEWLDDNDCSVLALLGDFGSGKSLHGYSLGIETAKNFLESPQKYRIPIRLTLKLCMDNNIQYVLEKQLENMKTSYNEFVGLSPTSKIIFILDGFDEMSRYITQKVTNERLRMLRQFCNQYKEAKIMLACRTQFFKSAQEEEETIEALKTGEKFKIKKLYLGKFTNNEIITCLQNRYGNSPTDTKPQVMHEKMKSKYDLIGMSSNPLILSMITDILDDIPTDRENLSGIYETYVDKWLEREMSKIGILKRSDKLSMKEKVMPWKALNQLEILKILPAVCTRSA